MCGGSNMNGVLLNPEEFEGRNPFQNLPPRTSWQSLANATESIHDAWPGNPLGLNVRVSKGISKGDAYRAGNHYRSKHNPLLAPTGTTLGLSGSAPGITNISGTSALASPNSPKDKEGGGGGSGGGGGGGYFMARTWGKRLGSYRNEASQFLRGRSKDPDLPFPKRFHYEDEGRGRPRPPSLDECISRTPLSRSGVDFVLKNQVNCIMQDPAVTVGAPGACAGARPLDVPRSPGRRLPAPRAPHPHPAAGSPGLEVQQLLHTRRADFEALLRGEDPHSSQRQHRLSTLAQLRSSLPSSPLSPPPPTGGQTAHSACRPSRGIVPFSADNQAGGAGAAAGGPPATAGGVPAPVGEAGAAGASSRRPLTRFTSLAGDSLGDEYKSLSEYEWEGRTVRHLPKVPITPPAPLSLSSPPKVPIISPSPPCPARMEQCKWGSGGRKCCPAARLDAERGGVCTVR